MTAVVDGVRRVCSWLEDDSSLDLARNVLFTLVVVAERIVSYPRGKPGCGRPGRRLKLPRPLPLGTTREPEHQPVIGIILFGEVGSEEEGCERRCQRMSRRTAMDDVRTINEVIPVGAG